ncbi:hypothetical protein JCM8547_004052 [Rhodosporidiobolus lusitaniae]
MAPSLLLNVPQPDSTLPAPSPVDSPNKPSHKAQKILKQALLANDVVTQGFSLYQTQLKEAAHKIRVVESSLSAFNNPLTTSSSHLQLEHDRLLSENAGLKKESEILAKQLAEARVEVFVEREERVKKVARKAREGKGKGKAMEGRKGRSADEEVDALREGNLLLASEVEHLQKRLLAAETTNYRLQAENRAFSSHVFHGAPLPSAFPPSFLPSPVSSSSRDLYGDEDSKLPFPPPSSSPAAPHTADTVFLDKANSTFYHVQSAEQYHAQQSINFTVTRPASYRPPGGSISTAVQKRPHEYGYEAYAKASVLSSASMPKPPAPPSSTSAPFEPSGDHPARNGLGKRRKTTGDQPGFAGQKRLPLAPPQQQQQRQQQGELLIFDKFGFRKNGPARRAPIKFADVPEFELNQEEREAMQAQMEEEEARFGALVLGRGDGMAVETSEDAVVPAASSSVKRRRTTTMGGDSDDLPAAAATMTSDVCPPPSAGPAAWSLPAPARARADIDVLPSLPQPVATGNGNGKGKGKRRALRPSASTAIAAAMMKDYMAVPGGSQEETAGEEEGGIEEVTEEEEEEEEMMKEEEEEMMKEEEEEKMMKEEEEDEEYVETEDDEEWVPSGGGGGSSRTIHANAGRALGQTPSALDLLAQASSSAAQQQPYSASSPPTAAAGAKKKKKKATSRVPAVNEDGTKKARIKYEKWKVEEDEVLIKAVIQVGCAWDKVAGLCPTRAYHQVRQRFIRGLDYGKNIPASLMHLKPAVLQSVSDFQSMKGKKKAAKHKSAADDDYY